MCTFVAGKLRQQQAIVTEGLAGGLEQRCSRRSRQLWRAEWVYCCLAQQAVGEEHQKGVNRRQQARGTGEGRGSLQSCYPQCGCIRPHRSVLLLGSWLPFYRPISLPIVQIQTSQYTLFALRRLCTWTSWSGLNGLHHAFLPLCIHSSPCHLLFY